LTTKAILAHDSKMRRGSRAIRYGVIQAAVALTMTGQALADDSLAPAAGGFSIGDPAPLFDDETDSNDWLRLDLQPPLSETSPLRFSGPSLSDGDEEPFQICASDFRRSWTVGIDSSQANDDDTDSRRRHQSVSPRPLGAGSLQLQRLCFTFVERNEDRLPA